MKQNDRQTKSLRDKQTTPQSDGQASAAKMMTTTNLDKMGEKEVAQVIGLNHWICTL